MRPAKPGDRCVVINDDIPANVGKQVSCDVQCKCEADRWACTGLEPFYDWLLGRPIRFPAGCSACFRKKDIVPLEDPDAETKQAAKPQPATTGRPYFSR